MAAGAIKGAAKTAANSKPVKRLIKLKDDVIRVDGRMSEAKLDRVVDAQAEAAHAFKNAVKKGGKGSRTARKKLEAQAGDLGMEVVGKGKNARLAPRAEIQEGIERATASLAKKHGHTAGAAGAGVGPGGVRDAIKQQLEEMTGMPFESLKMHPKLAEFADRARSGRSFAEAKETLGKIPPKQLAGRGAAIFGGAGALTLGGLALSEGGSSSANSLAHMNGMAPGAMYGAYGNAGYSGANPQLTALAHNMGSTGLTGNVS